MQICSCSTNHVESTSYCLVPHQKYQNEQGFNPHRTIIKSHMCILFDGPVHQQTSSVLRGRLQISHGSGGKWPQQPIGTADAPPAPQTRAWRYGGWKKNPPASSDMATENPYKWVHVWIWIGGQCRCLCIFHVEIIYKIMTNDDGTPCLISGKQS